MGLCWAEIYAPSMIQMTSLSVSLKRKSLEILYQSGSVLYWSMVMVGTSCLRYHVQPQHRKAECQCSRSECRPEIRGLPRLLDDEKNGGCLWTGENQLSISVVSMHPAENPDFYLMWRCNSQALFGVQLRVYNPILERASAMKRINLQSTAKSLDQVSKTTSYAMPATGRFYSGWRRIASNQPTVIGNQDQGALCFWRDNLEANQQILILSDKVEEMPDM